MAMTYAVLLDMLAEDARGDITEQADLTTVIVDFKTPYGKKTGPEKAKVFNRLDRPGQVGRVNVNNGSFANQGFNPDGATRRAPLQLTPKSGKYGFCQLDGDIEFPEGILRVGTSIGEGIDVFEEQSRMAGEGLARITERSVINHDLGAAEGVNAIGATSIGVTDASGYRPGMIFDHFNSTGLTLKASGLTVTAVADDGDGTGTLTVSAISVATVAGDLFFIAGSGGKVTPPSTDRCVNIADCMESTFNIYSGLTTTDQPAGTVDSTTTAWGNASGFRMMQRISVANGAKPDTLLVHPFQYQKIYESQNPNIRYVDGKSMDNYGPKLTFGGAVVVSTNNQKATRVDFLNTKENAAQYHQFWELGPVNTGGNGVWSKDILVQSQNRKSWIAYLSLGLNMKFSKRNAHGSMTALSAIA